MSIQDLGDYVAVRHTIRFGDCDPALIAYTGTIVDYALIAIDEFWKVALDGKGWFELNLDHDIGTAFVNLSFDFAAPITPRDDLNMQVRVLKKGRTSLTFRVTANHAGLAAFSATLTCVFIDRSTLTKITPPTRGQRQTGGQGLFRPEDNLESPYARDALRQLYRRIYRGDVAGCSLGAFEDATGLSLTDDNGLKDDLPPITTFLNRLLALTIDMQAVLFSAFEELLDQRIEGAIAAGVYDLGLETLRAESFRVTDARVIYTHPGSGAETQLLTIAEKRRNTPTSLADAFDWLDDPKARLLVNSRSGRAAVQVPATSLMLDDGTIEPRLRLVRPTEASTVPAKIMEDTHWLEADRSAFATAWTVELAEVPEFSEATLHIVAGLLLSIWKQLPQDETRVYRLQTDDGQRIIGRRVSPAWVATTLAADGPRTARGRYDQDAPEP